MKNWNRIGLVVFVLIGGTISFGFWSLQEFDNAFEKLSASSYVAISPLVRDVREISITPEVSATTSSRQEGVDDIDSKFQLIFSPKEDGVYIGCTYEISWPASTTMKSLEASLIDAGTLKPSGPVASGISKENIIDDGSQSLKWKVGAVWPGSYYVEVSKINGVEAEFRSKVFEINKMPQGVDEEEKIKICQESNGF